MKPVKDYEHIANALSQAIKAYVCSNEENTDCCRYELLSALEMSIHSLQYSLFTLLSSYGNWKSFLGLSDFTASRYKRYIRFNPSKVRQIRELKWFE